MLTDAIAPGEPCEAQYRVYVVNEQRWMLAHGVVDTAVDGGRPMVGAVIDITDEKAAEQALQGLNATLEERANAAS
jgi:hypothetical protein